MQTQRIDWSIFHCVCGNQLAFYFCTLRGKQVPPERWSSDCIRCGLCGRIIDLSQAKSETPTAN